MGIDFLSGDRNVLEVDSGDGCITLEMYLISPVANFILCVLYHTKRQKCPKSKQRHIKPLVK